MRLYSGAIRRRFSDVHYVYIVSVCIIMSNLLMFLNEMKCNSNSHSGKVYRAPLPHGKVNFRDDYLILMIMKYLYRLNMISTSYGRIWI